MLYEVVDNNEVVHSCLEWCDAVVISLEYENPHIREMTCRIYNVNDIDTPSDAVYIGRGTPFGNPYVIGVDGNRDEVCNMYENLISNNLEKLSEVKRYLKGKNLKCHCKPKRCHGDFLLKISNN